MVRGGERRDDEEVVTCVRQTPAGTLTLRSEVTRVDYSKRWIGHCRSITYSEGKPEQASESSKTASFATSFIALSPIL